MVRLTEYALPAYHRAKLMALLVVQDLVTEVAELKAHNKLRSQSDDMRQSHQYPQQQQQQQPPGNVPAVWGQAMIAASPDGRQSGAWPMQPAAAAPTAAELAAAQQLPQLLQKLQRTQEKLETRDASARKYKVEQCSSSQQAVCARTAT